MVDKKSIISTYRKYFDFPGFETNKYNLRVNETTGKIRVMDNVFLWTSPPDGVLPVAFERVDGSMQIQKRSLRSLIGCPETVGQHFNASQNRLTNLIGGPETVHGDYGAHNNPLESLEGLATRIDGKLLLSYSPTLPLLRTLVAREIVFDPLGYTGIENPGDILNQYAGQGRAGAIDCKRELVAAGFEGNARW